MKELTMMRSFGWKPDIVPIEASRTFKVAVAKELESVPSIPPFVNFTEEIISIGPLFQYALGTCVTQAMMQAMRLFWRNTYGMLNPPVMSRLAWYWDARAEMGETGNDSGLYPETAAAILRRRGYGLEKYWPYDEIEVFTPPPAVFRTHQVDQQDAIEDQAIETDDPAAKIYYTKLALSLGRPVAAGIHCDRGFMEYESGVWTRRPGSASLGRHYILIIGYDEGKQAFKCTNSWEDWGIVEGGCSFFWMSEEEMASERVADVRAIRAATLPSEMAA